MSKSHIINEYHSQACCLEIEPALQDTLRNLKIIIAFSLFTLSSHNVKRQGSSLTTTILIRPVV